MIELTHARSQPTRSSLEGPGGFVWWYIDLLDADGNGAVLIVSWGLPFLPGYVDSARRGQAPPAATRPSMNVVLYRGFSEAFYLLQEYSPDDAAHLADGTVRMRRSTMTATVVEGRLTLHIDVDCDVPSHAERLRGTVRVEGALARHTGSDVDAPHVWTPIAPVADGTVDLAVGSERWRFAGRAYHDRNSSELPITHLGCRRWTWARVSTGDVTWIAYDLEGDGTVPDRTLLLRCDATGSVRSFDTAHVVAEGWRRQFFGMQLPRRWQVDGAGAQLDLRVGAAVDRGPFYTRAPVSAVTPDGPALGWLEVVAPARIDLDRHRPLVEMAVHHTAGPNSMWLPLFSGPRAGRVARLLRPATPMLEAR